MIAKKLKPPFQSSLYKSNFDPDYVRDNSITQNSNRPRTNCRYSINTSKHSYLYEETDRQKFNINDLSISHTPTQKSKQAMKGNQPIAK